MSQIINEGAAKIRINKIEKISKEMGVFYNPVMSLNRDISILLLNSVNKANMQTADPLAASGVRSIRFIKELGKNKAKNISINDINKNAVKSIKENLALNKIQYKNNKKIFITNKDANLFLLNSNGFDYIDIDPFGSPNFMLDSACRRLARGGILAVTATDTSALCGTYPKACVRKYWAVPKRDFMMHETGLRILARKAQLIASQYDKALTPIFSYSKEHYMRVFFRNEKGRNKADEILKLHGIFNNAGPMWLGRLWDRNLCDKMRKNSLKNKIFRENGELVRFLRIISDESKIDAVGFYDLSSIAEKYGIKSLPKKYLIKENIRKSGYEASDTHFKSEGIRSDIHLSRLSKILANRRY
ncbi:hypothetical protein HY637_05060 [Candidatus Woesearchaeota archaeon]|nr:hypothetical protein [Candidatus Woesearchaeota archaeon]